VGGQALPRVLVRDHGHAGRRELRLVAGVVVGVVREHQQAHRKIADAVDAPHLRHQPAVDARTLAVHQHDARGRKAQQRVAARAGDDVQARPDEVGAERLVLRVRARARGRLQQRERERAARRIHRVAPSAQLPLVEKA
jgi:hypothetical protein